MFFSPFPLPYITVFGLYYNFVFEVTEALTLLRSFVAIYPPNVIRK